MARSELDELASGIEVLEAETDYLEALAAEVEIAELQADIAARRADIADGLVPEGMTRALFPHERRARVDFLAIDRDLTAARDAITGRLQADRGAFLALLEAELAHVDGTGIAGKLMDLDTSGIDNLPGARDLFNASVAFYRAQLVDLAHRAAARVQAEGAAQGVAPTDPVNLATRGIELQARRLTTGPHVDLVRALREEAVKAPPEQLAAGDRPPRIQRLDVQSLVASGRSLSDRPLDNYAKTATNQANGAGRNAGVATMPRPARIYASELLDANTCDPCAVIDGTEYESEEASLEDYPEGGYIECFGGDLCRGTRVFVWDEAPPTAEFPTPPPSPSQGGPPQPPPRPPGAAPDSPAEPGSSQRARHPPGRPRRQGPRFSPGRRGGPGHRARRHRRLEPDRVERSDQ